VYENFVGEKQLMRNDIHNEPDFFDTCGFRILSAIRRIIRAVDIHSRKLHSEFAITTPQMICIYELMRNDGITLSQLSKAVNIGNSTVNGIVDRLELKGLLTRQRSLKDRRKVLLHLTEAGRDITRQAPSLLQDKLSDALQNLPELEQVTIAMSLERVVALMEAEHLDTSPNLVPNGEIQNMETNPMSASGPPNDEFPTDATA
jgi:DNA-binding MarR family transcriptional regulator